MTSQLGESRYDPEDRPMIHATRCYEIFNKVMEGQKQNYYQAKGMALLGTAMLVKKETANADAEFEKAKSIIFAQFGDDHPMVCKFQANTVEALN